MRSPLSTFFAVIASMAMAACLTAAHAATPPVHAMPPKISPMSVVPGHIAQLVAITPGGYLFRETGSSRVYLVPRVAVSHERFFIGEKFFYSLSGGNLDYTPLQLFPIPPQQ